MFPLAEHAMNISVSLTLDVNCLYHKRWLWIHLKQEELSADIFLCDMYSVICQILNEAGILFRHVILRPSNCQ